MLLLTRGSDKDVDVRKDELEVAHGLEDLPLKGLAGVSHSEYHHHILE